MTQDKKILILADNRVGTYSQAVALAEESGLEYKILFLEYNFFKIIPNQLFSQSLIRLKNKSKRDVLAIKDKVDFIISAGRKPAPIALFIKNNIFKKHNFAPKIIQIMRPEIDFKKFDYVIIPEHDNPRPPYPSNLILSKGSLCKTNFNINKSPDFKIDKKNYELFFSLLIGGSSKSNKFKLSSAQKLIEKSLKFTEKHRGFLFIINSRRTDEEINNYIRKIENKNFIFYDYNLLKHNNPYHNIINISDLFIISGDSVSMISECCSTGKPVLIFDEEKISSKKHKKFHQELVINQHAKFFDHNLDNIMSFKPIKLQETKRISQLIF